MQRGSAAFIVGTLRASISEAGMRRRTSRDCHWRRSRHTAGGVAATATGEAAVHEGPPPIQYHQPATTLAADAATCTMAFNRREGPVT